MSIETIRQLKENAGKPKIKKVYTIPKKSAKKIAQEKEEKELRTPGEDTELQKWYKERQKQLTGKCIRCGTKYNHHNLQNAIAATAHILAKRENMFPSVMLHPENYIELPAMCGCHFWFDNFASWEEIALSSIWPIVLEKFKIIEPYIKERNKIPDIFAQEIKPKV